MHRENSTTSASRVRVCLSALVAVLIMVSVVRLPLSFGLTTASAQSHVMENTRWEATFQSNKSYDNPFMDVTLSVVYTGPGGHVINGLGFWDGDATYRIRMTFPTTGRWTYRTFASDPTDSGLHNHTGVINVIPYTGNNPLYRRGAIKVGPTRRYLVYADGTPFVWIGHTHWSSTVSGAFRKRSYYVRVGMLR